MLSMRASFVFVRFRWPTSLARIRWLALLATASFLAAGCGGSGDSEAGSVSRQPLQAAVIGATATFNLARSSYTITKTGTGYNVVANTGSEGSTAIGSGVQTLVFSDLTVDLGMYGKAQTILAADLKSLIELYIAYFNRVPDAAGLSYWIDQFKAGQTLDQIGQQFYAAALQYSSLTGYTAGMTNSDFVTLIYKNVLGRSSPDPVGLSYWTSSLGNGSQTRGTLIKTILASAHAYKGDASYGPVADLLDNKNTVGNFFAVEQGLSYLSPSDSIGKGMTIAAAISSSSADPVLSSIPSIFDGVSRPANVLFVTGGNGYVRALPTLNPASGIPASGGVFSVDRGVGSGSLAYDSKKDLLYVPFSPPSLLRTTDRPGISVIEQASVARGQVLATRTIVPLVDGANAGSGVPLFLDKTNDVLYVGVSLFQGARSAIAVIKNASKANGLVAPDAIIFVPLMSRFTIDLRRNIAYCVNITGIAGINVVPNINTVSGNAKFWLVTPPGGSVQDVAIDDVRDRLYLAAGFRGGYVVPSASVVLAGGQTNITSISASQAMALSVPNGPNVFPDSVNIDSTNDRLYIGVSQLAYVYNQASVLTSNSAPSAVFGLSTTNTSNVQGFAFP